MQASALSQYESNNIAVQMALLEYSKPRLKARFVTQDIELREAQRLRANVFATEYGVSFEGSNGFDKDHFDDFCEHINVYDEANGLLVATTRLLTGERAKLAGSFYSAQEFDITALENKLEGRILEIGRTCVHEDYRSGSAITVLWSTLADYLISRNFRYLLGCASISLRDGGHNFAAIMPELRRQYFVDESLRVKPVRGLFIDASLGSAKTSLPPLLKAYLRMGCKIGGEACWDHEFNCADVFVLLDVFTLTGRYAQRFLKAG